ncbi:hypothetical protein NX862_04715 [Rhodobacter sp. KR11]|uniref:hypothetical protein n=1 Tax=Rhodobacter sp. KR11 TaxID=2974588 RepID=UPI002221D5CA|nr:hypothetical protein [Rhodobacter sp. KR11]MCW1918047.1 hypothetical protein [Rhodobacter sp. KR11]
MTNLQMTFAAPEQICSTLPVLNAFNAFVASLFDLAEIEAFGVDDVWDPALDGWIKTAEAMRSEVVNRAEVVMLIAGCETWAARLKKVCAEFVRLMKSSEVREYCELAQDLRKRQWRRHSRTLPRAQMIALDAFSEAFENLLQCPDHCVDPAAPEPAQVFDRAA